MKKKKGAAAHCPQGTYRVTIRKNGKRERACAEITKKQMKMIRALEKQLKDKSREVKTTTTMLSAGAVMEALAAGVRLLA